MQCGNEHSRRPCKHLESLVSIKQKQSCFFLGLSENDDDDEKYILKWTVAQKRNLSGRPIAPNSEIFRGDRKPIDESPKKFVPLVPP